MLANIPEAPPPPPPPPQHPSKPRMPLAGIFPLAILKLLKEKPMHGYQIADELEKKLNRKVPRPLVYSTLRRLEEKGFVVSKWDTTGTGPARRVYYITDEGLEFLEKRIEDLRLFKRLLDLLVQE